MRSAGEFPIGSVATVGTFDGVHRGHWSLIRRVVDAARAEHRPAVLLTFDPHPLRIVRPDVAPPLLTTPEEKIEVLAESGLDYAVFLRFDRGTAALTPREFVERVLAGRLGVARLIIGYDHGFGRGRSGGVDTLRELGAELGFDVEVVGPVGGETPISSTRIRNALLEGDVLAAAEGLGRPYTLRGRVIRGDGRGRTLGFPTANLEVPDPSKLIPREGIYAARAAVNGGWVDGVMHIGPRPTFPGAGPTLELHLFDFDGDLYGRQLTVSFCARIRGVESFPSVEALVVAMEGDCDAARRLFREGAGACGPRRE